MGEDFRADWFSNIGDKICDGETNTTRIEID